MILKMNKTLKISAIVTISLFLIVYLIGKYNPFSMEFIITQHGIISEFIANNFILSSIICTLLIVVTVSLMGAITPVIILAGFYFGLTTALFISIAGEVLGAIIVFFYGRYLFKSYFLNKLGTRFKSFQEKFNNNAISYLMFIRVVGGTPFGVQNLLPAIFDMKFKDYLIATIIGVLPWAFILTSIGSSINDIVDAKEFDSSMLIDINYLLPLIVIALIILIPVIYKSIKKRIKS